MRLKYPMFSGKCSGHYGVGAYHNALNTLSYNVLWSPCMIIMGCVRHAQYSVLWLMVRIWLCGSVWVRDVLVGKQTVI